MKLLHSDVAFSAWKLWINLVVVVAMTTNCYCGNENDSELPSTNAA